MNRQNSGPDPEFISHGRDLDVLIAQGVALHGHLGPYLVSGIRMGLLALDLLGCSGYSASQVSGRCCRQRSKPNRRRNKPGCGCTPGKGNLRITSWCRPRAWFADQNGRTVTIEIRPEVTASFRRHSIEQASEYAKKLPLEELFLWNAPSS